MLRSDKVEGYETISAEVEADTKTAAQKNQKAIAAIGKDQWDDARKHIDAALIADVNHAPSHNTLGQIYFHEKNYYLAAWEYEFAIRLAPSIPEYHNNLGLVYEAADRLKEAEIQFGEAVASAPQNYHFVSNYARVRIRQGEINGETRQLLEDVVFLDPRPEWKDWARQQLTQSHLDIPTGYSTPTILHSDESAEDPPTSVPEMPSIPQVESQTIEF